MILYQFKKINEYTLDNIKKGELWLSSPHNFNDPFDPIIRIGCELDKEIFDICVDFYNSTTDREYERIKDYDALYLFPSFDGQEGDSPYPSFSESINWVLRGHPERQVRLLERIKEELGEDCYTVIAYASTYSNLGISCFSKAWYEPVMWAHYADNHSGICIKYEIDEKLLDSSLRLVEVQYSDRMPEYTPIQHDTAIESSILENHIRNKSLPWSYEKEWRLVSKVGSAGRNIKIPGKILSICCGLKTSSDSIQKISDAVKDNEDIMLGKVTKCSDYRKFDWCCVRPSSNKSELMYYSPECI